MKMSKNKNRFTRFVTAMISTLMLVVIFSFGAVSVMAMAADDNAGVVTVTDLPVAEEEFSVTPLESDENESMSFETPMVANDMNNVVMLAGEGSGSASADASYTKVINFFITWIRRIGAMVALVGAIMFGLAIKNNDAEQKQAGLLTLVAGFVVVAITTAVDMFDLFT